MINHGLKDVFISHFPLDADAHEKFNNMFSDISHKQSAHNCLKKGAQTIGTECLFVLLTQQRRQPVDVGLTMRVQEGDNFSFSRCCS